MSSQPKRLLISHFAVLARALGHEHRQELLENIGQGEQSVEARWAGKQVLYRLAEVPVIKEIAALWTLAVFNPRGMTRYGAAQQLS